MKALIMTFLSLFLLSCSTTPQGLNLKKSPTGSGEKISGAINVSEIATYKYPDMIENSIKAECTDITSKIGTFTKSYAKEKGMKVKLSKNVKKGAKGNNLVIEILNAVSKGNAFIGHQKFILIHASLYKDGRLVDDIKLQRDSSGGFAAGFKGSCSVLGRCAKAIGKDLSLWLAKYNTNSK
jgi:hypothetical protein